MKKVELTKPTLILVTGVTGCGKTTFTRELVRHVTDAHHIDKDTLNDAFLTTINPEDEGFLLYKMAGTPTPASDSFYQEFVKLQSYHAMLALARDDINTGKHPILDGCYVKELRGDYLERVVQPFFEGVEHQTKIILYHADESVVRARQRRRGLPRDQRSDEAWQRLLQEQPIIPPEIERLDHIKIDLGKPTETGIKKALEYLAA